MDTLPLQRCLCKGGVGTACSGHCVWGGELRGVRLSCLTQIVCAGLGRDCRHMGTLPPVQTRAGPSVAALTLPGDTRCHGNLAPRRREAFLPRARLSSTAGAGWAAGQAGRVLGRIRAPTHSPCSAICTCCGCTGNVGVFGSLPAFPQGSSVELRTALGQQGCSQALILQDKVTTDLLASLTCFADQLIH